MPTSCPPVPPASPVGDIPCFVLPPRWSSEDQVALHGFLLARQDGPVRISAGQVRRADSLMIQYLIAAARAWASSGRELTVVDRAPVFDEALHLIGVTPDMMAGRA